MATWTGTYDLRGVEGLVYSGEWDSDWYGFDHDAAFAAVAGPYRALVGGFSTSTTLSFPPEGFQSYVGATFGYIGNFFYCPPYALNTVYSPSGMFYLPNTSLSEFGAGEFNYTLAFTGAASVDGSREIRFHTVPEPSPSLLILGICISAGIALRRRG